MADDEPDPSAARKRSLGDRIRAGSASRPAAGRPATASTKAIIEGLDPRERLFSFAAGGASALLGLITYLVQTNNAHFRLAKGQHTPQTTLFLGILFGVLLVGATLWGRRALIGFAALFAFLGFGLPGGFPFLALAVWLLYRSWKFQKEATAAAKAAKADRANGSPPSGSTGGAPRSVSKETRPTRESPRASRSKTPARPEANKRFTPKRPPPPAPKPSRRQRKATKTAD